MLLSICFRPVTSLIISYLQTRFQIKPICFSFVVENFRSIIFICRMAIRLHENNEKFSLLRPFAETEIKDTGTTPIKWQTNVRKVFGILPLALLNLKGRPIFSLLNSPATSATDQIVLYGIFDSVACEIYSVWNRSNGLAMKLYSSVSRSQLMRSFALTSHSALYALFPTPPVRHSSDVAGHCKRHTLEFDG